MPTPIPGIPYIDPNVEHVDVQRLKDMTAQKLKRLRKTMVVRDGDSPLAVVVSYKTFLRIQDELTSLSERVDDYEAEDDSMLWGGSPLFGDLGAFDEPGEEGEFEDDGEDLKIVNDNEKKEESAS